MVVPYIASAVMHIVFFGWVILNPAPKPDLPFNRDQVLDVSMVDMKDAMSPAPSAEENITENKVAAEPAPPKEQIEPEPVEEPPEDAVPIPSEAEPEPEKAVPAEPAEPKIKTSLKKKTFKRKTVKKPVQKVEKPQEAPKADAVSEALKKLQKKVKAAEKNGEYKAGASGSGMAAGKGAGGAAGRRRAELIDMYRVEIAQRVNKNWAFSGQLAGENKNLMASLVFKVMPDGEIRDIFFIDRSGNEYLDDSAYKAVVKTNPAPPHPKGLVEAFVDVGLRFTPEGIR